MSSKNRASSAVVFRFNEYSLFFPSLFSVIKSASFKMRRLIDTPDIVKLKYCAISVGVMISLFLSSNIMRLLLSSESAFQGEPIYVIYTLIVIELYKYLNMSTYRNMWCH